MQYLYLILLYRALECWRTKSFEEITSKNVVILLIVNTLPQMLHAIAESWKNPNGLTPNLVCISHNDVNVTPHSLARRDVQHAMHYNSRYT